MITREEFYSMDKQERAERLVRLFINHRAKIEADINDRISDNEYATRYLHVEPVSFNQWMNRTRFPGEYNVVFNLLPVLGDEVLELIDISDKKQRSILKLLARWRDLDEEKQNQIDRIINEDKRGKTKEPAI